MQKTVHSSKNAASVRGVEQPAARRRPALPQVTVAQALQVFVSTLLRAGLLYERYQSELQSDLFHSVAARAFTLHRCRCTC